MKNFTIYSLPAADRPRERLRTMGEESLSTLELLNILLGRGGSGESVMLLSQRILQKFGNLQNIADAPLEELCAIKGIGFAKASQIKAAFELGKRARDASSHASDKIIINTALKAAQLLSPQLHNKKKEHIIVLSLDTRKALIKKSLISIGTLDASIIHPRDIFKEAILDFAAGFILAHNHPSGNPEPSPDDRIITKQLNEAAKFLDIAFLDHIIIGNPSYYSFRENQKELFN